MIIVINAQLRAACDVLVGQLLQTKKDDVLVLTADMDSDADVVQEIFEAATKLEAKPLMVWMNTPAGVSEAADPDLPAVALTALLEQADIWVELNSKWLLYSNIYYDALKNNKTLRHAELTGVRSDGMVNCVGQVDYEAMREFTLLLRDKISAAKRMRMTSSLGEDIEFENCPGRPVSFKLGVMDKPGTHLFVGQIGWTPEHESINGKIIFDGSIAPDIGILEQPIEMILQQGKVVAVSGGEQAAAYEAWLKSYNHPQMLTVAHTGIGFNPGAKVVGSIIEDQRVMGSTT